MNRTAIRLSRAALLTAAFLLPPIAAIAQTQALPFLDDSAVQTINLTMDPANWALLQQYYELDTYYSGTFTWNGITETVGIRQHGNGSRSPIKPNLDINFAKYTAAQTFLGLPFIMLKANNEDPSNLREWLSMKMFRKMGIPAPREAPAQVFVNGQLLGFYYIVEHVDETFLQRNYGESGGYLYEYQSVNFYDFGNLGTDPSLYAPYLKLKTNQAAPDLQTFSNLVQLINQPMSSTFTDDDFIAALSQYIDPKQFLLYGATEQTLCGADSLIGGQQGMNNFDLYQFQGTTLYNLIPWDKDSTLNDVQRDVMDGIFNGLYINVLAQRLVSIPAYAQFYMAAMSKAANLMGSTGDWADSEITREYNVIQAAASNDPYKQCPEPAGLTTCTSQDFETGVVDVHSFFTARQQFVVSEIVTDGYLPSTAGPRISAGGVTSYGGLTALSPGGLATVAGTGLATAATTGSGNPLPRILGNAFVAVEGVRAPLMSTSSGALLFQVPGDVALGTASVVAFNNGDTTATADTAVQAAAPSILVIVHQDGSLVTPSQPVIPGEVISAYGTGLGVVTGTLPIAYAAIDGSETTLLSPQFLLGNLPLAVEYSGLAPGYVGLYQVNAAVPVTLGSTTPSAFSLTLGGLTAPWTAQ